MGGYNPEFGIPLNPWNADRWPGASSSGSGAATAAGLCFASIGTDTGGSIRYPASANGLVGLKPTYGRVSRYGVLALSPSLDHVGPIARSVADAAILFDAIAGNDPKDSTSLTDPSPSALAEAGKGIEGLRIGIDRDYASKDIDPGQVASIEEALKVLAGFGARIIDVKMPDITGMRNTWLAICASEALAVHKANYPSRAAEYGPYFRDVLAMGAAIPPPAVATAQAWRAKFTTGFTTLLDSVDVMACPAGGAPAWPVSRELQLSPMAVFGAAWGKESPRASEFTMPMDRAGKRLDEALLCRVAGAYERVTKWHERHPNV